MIDVYPVAGIIPNQEAGDSQEDSMAKKLPIGRPLQERDDRFGKLLTAKRKGAGLTQIALARGIGVSQQVVCRWETGERLIPVDKLLELAAFLKCPPEELLPKGRKTTRKRGSPPS